MYSLVCTSGTQLLMLTGRVVDDWQNLATSLDAHLQAYQKHGLLGLLTPEVSLTVVKQFPRLNFKQIVAE